MALADIYRSFSPGRAESTEPRRERESSLEAALNALVARARVEYPQLPACALSDEELVGHLAGRLPAGTDLATVHAGDLLLALVCARGLPEGLATLEKTILSSKRLAAALSRIDPSPAFVDEVLQAVRERILLAAAGKPPRIADYSGRGSLASWLQVVALRVALDLRPDRAVQGSESLPDKAGEQDPELRLLQQRYGKAFEDAITQAFASLTDEQYNLLRLQIVDGLQTARIAALFHVDRSTIKRRLSECREALLAETRRILTGTLRVSPHSLESLLRLVRSQLHVSVARLLRERDEG